MGSYRQLTGMMKPPNRPDRVAPVPEHYEGENVPYRGTQTHGVAIPKDAEYESREFEFKQDDTKIAYLPDPDDSIEDPIAVRIVQGDSRRERLDWRPARYRVTDQGQRILNRHEKRRDVRIKVHFQTDGVDSKPVYLGNDAGVQPYTGYQLDRGETLTPFNSTEDVWAICNPGESVEVSIMYTFGVEI